VSKEMEKIEFDLISDKVMLSLVGDSRMEIAKKYQELIALIHTNYNARLSLINDLKKKNTNNAEDLQNIIICRWQCESLKYLLDQTILKEKDGE